MNGTFPLTKSAKGKSDRYYCRAIPFAKRFYTDRNVGPKWRTVTKRPRTYSKK